MKNYFLFVIMFSSLGRANDNAIEITYNVPTCEAVSSEKSYSICLLNLSSSDITQKDIDLYSFIKHHAGFKGTIEHFGLWQSGRYIRIAVAKEFFTRSTRQVTPLALRYILTHLRSRGTTAPGCAFSWYDDSPPYLTTPVLKLAKNEDGYYCHY